MPARPAPVLPGPGGAARLSRLVRAVRAGAAAYPGDWQDVVDALRPEIPRLWEQLPEADKRLFLSHVARYWEVHRHRMPPETARRAEALVSAGRLSVHRGRVTAATGQGGGVRVRIDCDGSVSELAVGWLINCTGPGADITATGDPLLRQLLDLGLARADPLRLGLDADAHGAVRDADGRPASDLFALGPLLRGCRYETTAIPEIRGQAAALARQLIAALGRIRPDRAGFRQAAGFRLVRGALEADGCAEQQDGAAPGAGFRVEDEQAVDGAGRPVGDLGAGAFQRKAVVFDAAQRGAQIGDHLLRPDDPDRAGGTAGVAG